MRRRLLAFAPIVLVACRGAAERDTTSEHAVSAPAITQDERMAWWRDARFGMFVHWGLYAIPAGKWGDRTDHGEWIRESAHIELPEYERLLGQFDPVDFDADAWASAAARAGMRYLVVTSKHHDGFCLFDSKETDWDVASTPFRRDVLKELADACARHGVRFCTYHSIMDWHHPDYLPRRGWEQRSAAGADFARYERYLHAEVSEIVERYHPAVMWFDGEWEETWSHERGVRLFDLCRRLDPAMIVNNRVDANRGGMGGFSTAKDARGDFATPEQEVPTTGMPGVDWETCMTMNDHWGFNAADDRWKSSEELVRTLCDVASKGGNFLLNVGPTAKGTFPREALERLADVGRWMDANAEAIRGTSASPLGTLDFGRCTAKRRGDATTLYLSVFERPESGKLELHGLANAPRSARLLADPSRKLAVSRADDAIVVELPTDAGALVPVVAIEIDGAPEVHRPPAIEAASSLFLDAVDVRFDATAPEGSSARPVVRYTTDGSEPTVASPVARGPFRLSESGIVRARSFDGSRPLTASSARTFTRVEARPAFAPPSRKAGVACERFAGTFDALPDLTEKKPDARYVMPSFALPAGSVEEHVARRYTGFVEVPRTAVYAFALVSDDGAKLYVDDECVVDLDGLHGALEKRGQIALARGCHAMRVEWFNKTGGAVLDLRMGEVGGALLPIPSERLGHVPATAPAEDEEGGAPGDRARGR